jgi:hypothetical protein
MIFMCKKYLQNELLQNIEKTNKFENKIFLKINSVNLEFKNTASALLGVKMANNI